MLRGTVAFAECLHPLHHEIGLGQQTEELRQLRLDVVYGGSGVGNVGLTPWICIWLVIPFAVAHVVKERGQITLKFHLTHDALHLFTDASDFVQTDLMNFFGG